MATKRLDSRVAIVTGASRGLGRAIAEALGAEGAVVAVVARTESVWDERLPGTIHDTVETIKASGGHALAIPADLSREDELERLVETARAELGPIDLLVNNAAVTVSARPPAEGGAALAAQPSKPALRLGGAQGIQSFPLKSYRLHFGVNLFAPYRLMQLVLPDMIASGRGSIVNVSSNAAFTPGEGPYESAGKPAMFAYGSSKAALHNLTQAVAIEMAPHGITANVLIPSRPIYTPGTAILYKGLQQPEWSSAESFAQALVEVTLASPEERTGQILFHEDLLG